MRSILLIRKCCVVFLAFCLSMSCQNSPSGKKTDKSPTLENPSNENRVSGMQFRLLSPQESGIRFSNVIKEDYQYNILNFEYLYNGGGVSVGDINNDGLPDLYFTATFASNKLYLNKGNLQFEDITDKAKVAAASGFKTGTTMADINHDGYLDIYVCRTSKSEDGQKDNLVFINNGDLTFTESAAKMGLKDFSNSNHANFFDYDLDGDLDLYLLNHRLGFKDAVRLRLEQTPDGGLRRKTNPQTPYESDRLYRNEGNGRFKNVSLEAGINNSAFGLSATVADINNDGWPDIYVANDYIEPEYLYINNGDGTFTDRQPEYLRHMSQNSMGTDIADFNNDGLLDIITLDMIAEDPIRYKELMNVMQLERYETLVKYGYGHQVGRNVLQLNNGPSDQSGQVTFSEIGQLAGISNTDWSWGALFGDFDNDGLKDIFIANGYKRDVTNLDYMVYTRDSIEKSGGVSQRRFPDINTFLDLIPSTKLQNYLFRNKGDLSFENVSTKSGLSQKTFSNGTAYGDLDGDGDLDLIVNNIGDPAFVYENQSSGNNFLQVKLAGGEKNTQGVGAKIDITLPDGSIQHQEMTANRGFFSSSELLFHFGLGNYTTVSALKITWPDGKVQRMKDVSANQKLTLKYSKARKEQLPEQPAPEATIFKALPANAGINYTHQENEFQDFNRERLLPHKLSKLGPFIATGDVNGDQLEDFYVGGAMGTAGSLFIQLSNGQFRENAKSTWEADQASEDMDALFFDAEGDGDLDLYVVSGGHAFPMNDPVYTDRLYLNDGKGNFSKSVNFPKLRSSGSCASVYDYDQDGDLDLFVGGRVSPGRYPTPPTSYVLQNNGGRFKDVTSSVAPEFANIGMVTDLFWVDVDGDQAAEMVAVGEWMPITIFKNQDGKLKALPPIPNSSAMWNCLAVDDFDQDGDMDLVAGNVGKNTRLKASPTAPLNIYAKDFDKNGAIDPIMTFSLNNKDYPFPGRDMLVKQIPKVKKNFPKYSKYARSSINDIFSAEELKDALKLQATTLSTTYFENQGNGTFKAVELPNEVQLAPVMDIFSADINQDSFPDLIMVGNHSNAETETGVYDAFNGAVLLNDGKGNFSALSARASGLWASGEARDIVKLKLADGREAVLISNNNGPLQVFQVITNKALQ